MYFTKDALQANANLRSQWGMMWNMRDQANARLAANADIGFTREFWAELDNQIVQNRDTVDGMEIIQDLASVQKVLNVGKTASLFNASGDIADDVSVSIDGHAPFSWDQSEYNQDGDPIPVFTAGYGVNWRHSVGLSSVGVDLALDSQLVKLRKFNKKRVAYYLNGDANISVNGYAAQGLLNHRNASKIDLTKGSASGANIDLTKATPEEVLAFFGPTGAFGINARANKVTRYDVLWVSYEIWANIAKPYVVSVGGSSNGIVSGSVLDAIKPFMAVGDVRPTYALTGNEFFAYERRADVVQPLVGQATSVFAMPRPTPLDNFNFMIWSAEGIQVKRDGEGLSGVVYGAELSS